MKSALASVVPLRSLSLSVREKNLHKDQTKNRLRSARICHSLRKPRNQRLRNHGSAKKIDDAERKWGE